MDPRLEAEDDGSGFGYGATHIPHAVVPLVSKITLMPTSPRLGQPFALRIKLSEAVF